MSEFWSAVFFFFAGFWFGVTMMPSRTYYEKQAIAHECAHYNSFNGEFAWGSVTEATK